MKKLIYSLATLAAVLFAVSCTEKGANLNDSATTTFKVSVPAVIPTKAIADGKNTDHLYYQVYDVDYSRCLAEGEAMGSIDTQENRMTFTVNLKLVIDQSYNIIFWAQKDGVTYYNLTDLRKVKVNNNYYKFNANDESRAAFYATVLFKTAADGQPYTVNGELINSVPLTRPFAQLNLGTDSLVSSLTEDIVVDSTTVTISNLANIFNTVDKVGEGDVSVRFVATATPNGSVDNTSQLLTVGNDTYHWLGMNYLIARGNQRDMVGVQTEIFTNAGKVTHDISNVPLRENYRTNLIGNFLIADVEFDIYVDKNFNPDQDDHNIDINAI